MAKAKKKTKAKSKAKAKRGKAKAKKPAASAGGARGGAEAGGGAGGGALGGAGARSARGSSSFFGNLFGWKIDTNNPMSYGMVSGAGKDTIGGGIGPAMDATLARDRLRAGRRTSTRRSPRRRRSARRRSCRARRTARSSWRCSAISRTTSSGWSRADQRPDERDRHDDRAADDVVPEEADRRSQPHRDHGRLRRHHGDEGGRAAHALA